MVGMGDIDILACDYCEASISRLSRLLNLLYCHSNYICQVMQQWMWRKLSFLCNAGIMGVATMCVYVHA